MMSGSAGCSYDVRQGVSRAVHGGLLIVVEIAKEALLALMSRAAHKHGPLEPRSCLHTPGARRGSSAHCSSAVMRRSRKSRGSSANRLGGTPWARVKARENTSTAS